MTDLTLQRFAYSPIGTFGRFILPSGREVYTVERPWVGNRPTVSCIPEGRYTLRQRDSAVVSRTTRGAYQRGWEVCDVPGRSLIMIHVGNTMDDLAGCIAPGNRLGYVGNRWAVLNSRETFDILMHELAAQDEWKLQILPYIVEYP